MPHEAPAADTAPSWPYASLLLFGIFGPYDEAGRAIALRGAFGFALLITGLILTTGDTGGAVYAVGSVAMIGAVGFMLWSMAVYIRALDELSRQIQLEAFAWSYGLVFLLCFVVVAVGGGPAGASVNPGLIILGEPIRGLALVLVARRYR